MGIRFNTNTWRAPLLIIDSWLPHRTEPAVARPQPLAIQRFARAGWLGRPVVAQAMTPAELAVTALPCDKPKLSRVRRAGSREPWGQDKRLVLAGRVSDVCAELDRLVAMEQRLSQSRA
jgi:hypothetical protein